MKRVILLTTGGTIASGTGPQGLAPTLSGADLLARVPEIARLCRATVRDVLRLDSSNMQPEDWSELAETTCGALAHADGVVVTHGTDTLANTAAMLTFMLQGLDRPVILTGSQYPIDAPGSDGPRNLEDAFLAALADCPGVHVVFGGSILRGVRTVKMRTRSRNAFESVNAPPVGSVADGRVILDGPCRVYGDGRLACDTRIDPRVFLLKMVPGLEPESLDLLVGSGIQGLVIESFGAGGLPNLRRSFVPKIEQLLSVGIPVVVVTQCRYEGSDLSVYEVGRRIAEAGAIPGHDMTTEAAVAKLMWVLGHTRNLEEVRRLMLANLCGEIDPGSTGEEGATP